MRESPSPFTEKYFAFSAQKEGKIFFSMFDVFIPDIAQNVSFGTLLLWPFYQLKCFRCHRFVDWRRPRFLSLKY